MNSLRIAAVLALATGLARADVIPLVAFNQLEIPITPFSNMASGYQATNPGFRAVIRSTDGDFIAGGPLTMDAVIRGTTDDASQGSAYGRLVLSVDMEESYPGISSGIMSGNYKGTLSICMAKDPTSSIQNTECQNLSGNIHPERPFQWLNKPIDFTVQNGNIKITKYSGSTGEGGTSQQLSLAVYHPAYGFAAPGKAFKDYQSPLVLDLDGNGGLDLVNVWATAPAVWFDLSGGGEKLRTGWVKPTDGFLYDGRKAACVTSGAQLFGEFTGSKDGKRTFENGFKALEGLFDGKGTGKVAVTEAGGLRVWRDLNQDGVCTANETAPASRFVKEISLNYRTVKNVTLTEDNEVRLLGSYLGADGRNHVMGDVWFKQRRNVTAAR